MDEFDSWKDRISLVRPVFELAAFALTTFTWNGLAFVAAFAAIRGYWTPSPALEAMGWTGQAIYIAFAAIVTLFSLGIIASLNLSLLSLLLALNRDLEGHPSPWVWAPHAFLSKPVIYCAVMYVFILSTFLSLQLLAVLDKGGG